MTEKLYKHDVWEWSRDMSVYLSGVPSRKAMAENAHNEMDRILETATEENKEEIIEFATDLRHKIATIQANLNVTIEAILQELELTPEIGLWRTSDLTRYMGAAQQYEQPDLLISAVLASPNVELLFELVEPGYDE